MSFKGTMEMTGRGDEDEVQLKSEKGTKVTVVEFKCEWKSHFTCALVLS